MLASFNSLTRKIVDLITALLKFTCFFQSQHYSRNAVHIPKDDYLITVDTTSLDQNKLYYCTFTLVA